MISFNVIGNIIFKFADNYFLNCEQKSSDSIS